MKKEEKIPAQSCAISARELVNLMDKISGLLSSSDIILEAISLDLKSDSGKEALSILKLNINEVKKYYRGTSL